MYKRRARLLLAGDTDDGRAAAVARVAAGEPYADWLEVRSAPSMQELTPEQLQWADLLVPLDAVAAAHCPAERPPTCRVRRWRLPAASDPSWPAAAVAALDCTVGGMRLLSRSDQELDELHDPDDLDDLDAEPAMAPVPPGDLEPGPRPEPG